MPLPVHINDILQHLTPVALAAKVHMPCRRIRNSFTVKKYKISSAEFDQLLAEYYHHHMVRWMLYPRTDASISFDFEDCLHSARQLLNHLSSRALLTCMQNSFDGVNGGAVSAVDALTDAYNDSIYESWVHKILADYLAPPDYDLRKRLVQQYIKIHNPFLPKHHDKYHSDLHQLCLALDLPKILWMHVQLQDNYRRNMLTCFGHGIDPITRNWRWIKPRSPGDPDFM